MTAPTPADIDAIRERHEKHRNEIWFTPETVDTLLAAIAERDGTIERLTKEAAIWDAQAGARHADVTALQAEVARLTAELAAANERAEQAASKIQSEIVEWLRTESRHHAWGETTKRALWAAADALEFSPWQRWMEFIARGEPQGVNDA